VQPSSLQLHVPGACGTVTGRSGAGGSNTQFMVTLTESGTIGDGSDVQLGGQTGSGKEETSVVLSGLPIVGLATLKS
jgi:hypothetical protein